MGALRVGVYENGKLKFAGRVGTGFSEKLLKLLSAELNKTAVKDCPFVNLPATGRGLDPGLTAAEMKRCVWVKPIIISEVKFTEWTRDDRLRHPVFIGLREDKNPTGWGPAGVFEAETNSSSSAKCCCIVVRPQIQASPSSFEPVASYSPSAMTTSRALPSIFPFTDESMWQMI
jgi:ATP-dependent DNA ligase